MAGPPGFAFQPEWDINEAPVVGNGYPAAADEDPDPEAIAQAQAEARLANNEWCGCGNCVVMPTAIECICCREIARCLDLQAHGCVRDHEDFVRVCLTRVVLRVFNVARRDIRGHRARARVRGRAPNQELDNKSYRYASYRLFTYLVHGYLGRGVRKVIPSCVVSRIRQEFPQPSGVYIGFRRGEDNEDIEVPEHHAI
ncbi:P2X purinoceptor 7-like [Lytechinus pictus]|uniref:P2X purinoceptor 7-like n=1 Tax=Lytechinus pictus TaxID=7653 RepID=UPI0030BA0826